MTHRKSFLIPAALLCAMACADVSAADTAVNFTGSLVTPGASTLPQGVWDIEPYLIYTNINGYYDSQGNRHTRENALSQWQTLVPIFYGITDRVQAQVTLGAARSTTKDAHTDGLRATDTTVGLRYKLISPDANKGGPTVTVGYSHRFPTGSYDRLDENPLNGIGNGANVDTFSLLMQNSVLLGDGRPLRFRAALSYSLPPSKVAVQGSSSYDTPKDFYGHARLGNAVSISTGAEYSINAQWVLAMDLSYDRQGASQITGIKGTGATTSPFSRRDDARYVYSMAPAVEYNINDRIGVIGGVQFSFAGRNSSAFVAPQVAVNMVF